MSRVIAKGVEFKVTDLDDGWVLKECIHSRVNTIEQLFQDEADYKLFQKYLGKFLPETIHFRKENKNFIKQKRIIGKHLYELNNTEIIKDKIKSQLIEFFANCLEMWNEEGRIPDLYGPKGLFLKGNNPRYCRNIILEEATNKVFLIDTAAHPLAFSKKAKFPYSFWLAILRFNLRRFLKKLKTPSF